MDGVSSVQYREHRCTSASSKDGGKIDERRTHRSGIAARVILAFVEPERLVQHLVESDVGSLFELAVIDKRRPGSHRYGVILVGLEPPSRRCLEPVVAHADRQAVSHAVRDRSGSRDAPRRGIGCSDLRRQVERQRAKKREATSSKERWAGLSREPIKVARTSPSLRGAKISRDSS